MIIPARDRRFARSCYRHLAGSLGVAVTEALIARGLLRIPSATVFELTRAGRVWFAALGIAPDAPARRCLDGTEGRDHLGGPLAVRLLDRLLALGWLERPDPGNRTLGLTPTGAEALAGRLGLTGLQVSASRSAEVTRPPQRS
ncbi:MAG: hypothetical protein WCO00_09870 [Rhodospirillaceae bacterium]